MCVCVCVCYLVTARVHTVTMKQQPTITQPHPPSRGASEPLCCLPATIAAGSCSQFLVLVLVLGGLVKENKLVIESVVLNNWFTLVCLRKNQEVDLKIVVLKVWLQAEVPRWSHSLSSSLKENWGGRAESRRSSGESSGWTNAGEVWQEWEKWRSGAELSWLRNGIILVWVWTCRAVSKKPLQSINHQLTLNH